MDDPPLTTLTTTSSSTIASTYDSIMKRLINIIRTHRVRGNGNGSGSTSTSSDSGSNSWSSNGDESTSSTTTHVFKQLEELWDLCAAPPPPPPPPPPPQLQHCAQSPPQESQSASKSNNLKRDSSFKDRLADTASARTSTAAAANAKKPRLSPTNTSKLAENETTVNTNTKSPPYVITESSKSPPLYTVSQTQLQAQPPPTIKLDADVVEFSDLNSMIVDMLDFCCFICKQFNQEPNNRLIECRQCTQLYHQQCHEPPIDKEAIGSCGGDSVAKDNSSGSISGHHQMAWSIPICMNCTTPVAIAAAGTPTHTNDSLTNPVDTTSTAAKIAQVTAAVANAPLAAKSPPPHLAATSQPVCASASKSPPHVFFTLNNGSSSNTHFTTSTELFRKDKPVLTSSTLKPDSSLTQLVAKQSSQQPVKGLAALATKLSTPSSSPATTPQQQQQATLTNGMVRSASANSKISHDDLFKKFRQSVNNSNSSNTSSTSSMSGLDLKRKFLASSSSSHSHSHSHSTQSSPISMASSSSAAALSAPAVKKPLFNLAAGSTSPQPQSATNKPPSTNLLVNSIAKK